jgi:hypothetical protein
MSSRGSVIAGISDCLGNRKHYNILRQTVDKRGQQLYSIGMSQWIVAWGPLSKHAHPHPCQGNGWSRRLLLKSWSYRIIFLRQYKTPTWYCGKIVLLKIFNTWKALVLQLTKVLQVNH